VGGACECSACPEGKPGVDPVEGDRGCLAMSTRANLGAPWRGALRAEIRGVLDYGHGREVSAWAITGEEIYQRGSCRPVDDGARCKRGVGGVLVNAQPARRGNLGVDYEIGCDRCGKRGDSMFGLFSPAEDKTLWSCLDCLEKSEARRFFWRKSDLARLRKNLSAMQRRATMARTVKPKWEG
jgi:hypothetical protein